MKRIHLKSVNDFLSDEEMKLVIGRDLDEDLKGYSEGVNSSCDKITPCKGKNYKASCTYICNGKNYSGRCCTIQGWTQLHCSDAGDLFC